jgi:hypothetical protein
MARVFVIHEVSEDPEGDWRLCFQWCRYVYDNGDTEGGYRFIWRRKKDDSLQAARGQARIESIKKAERLMKMAHKAGWGDNDAKRDENCHCNSCRKRFAQKGVATATS